MSEHNCDGWDSCPNPAHRPITLTDFLLARIAEDERRANDALAEPNYPHFGNTAADALLGLAESEGADTFALLHFGRHRPARVLAECEAKRRIVEEWRAADKAEEEFDGEGDGWPEIDRLRSVVDALCGAMKALALPYADHEDFKEEWRA